MLLLGRRIQFRPIDGDSAAADCGIIQAPNIVETSVTRTLSPARLPSKDLLMNFVLQPWHLLLMILAGWVNREQQQVIEYLRTENQVLREKLGKSRLLLNDDQRRRLAVKAKVLGRKLLKEVGTLFTPDTLLRWHRMLVAKKWDYSHKREKMGRPSITPEVVELVLRMA